MDVYLSLGLTILAFAVVFLMGFEMWHYRQQKKFAGCVSHNNTMMLNDDVEEDAFLVSRRGEQLQMDFDSAQASLAKSPIKPMTQSVSPRFQTAAATPRPPVATTPMKKPDNDLLQLSVIAKQGRKFASYELLQAISATGMQFGEMNIFHYYTQSPAGKKALFSLASLTKPGYFDLDRMGNFTCAGLTLFAQLSDVEDPQQAFELMLKTADQLAEDLDGELRADPRTVWSNETLAQYQEKVLYFQLENA